MKKYIYIYSEKTAAVTKTPMMFLQKLICENLRSDFDFMDIMYIDDDNLKKYQIIFLDFYAIYAKYINLLLIEKQMNFIGKCKNVALITRDLHFGTFIDTNKNYGYDVMKSMIKKLNVKYIISNYACVEFTYIINITNCIPYVLSHHLDTKIFYANNLAEKNIDVFVFGADFPHVYPTRNRIKKIVSTMNINKVILNHGDVRHSKYRYDGLANIMRNSWLTVATPSIYNYLVMKYFEASACGSVVLGNMADQGKDIWQDNFIEIKPSNTDDEIKNIIMNALNNKEKLLEISEKMSKKINNEYDYKNYGEKLGDIANDITYKYLADDVNQSADL